MHLITRADWDGLVSSVLLTTVEPVEVIHFAYPKDIQDGKINLPDNSIIVNLPYHPDAAMWFDHHTSEEEWAAVQRAFLSPRGRFGAAPSTARLIYEHYDGDVRLAKYTHLIAVTDRLDSAHLARTEVLNPSGYILLAFTMDPRTGLHEIDLEVYFLMLVDWLKSKSVDQILAEPEVRQMTDRLRADEHRFRQMLLKHSRLEGNVVISDLRGVNLPAGNRYVIYTLFPTATVAVRLYDGKGSNSTIAVGHNLFNRVCRTNLGKLLAEYGGGGHVGAATAQVPQAEADAKFREIIERLKE